MKSLLVLLLVVLGGGVAHADLRSLAKWRGGAWLHYELTEVHAVDHTPAAPALKFDDLALAGMRLHGFASPGRVGYLFGLDVAGGATLGRAGFAYDVALLPLGVATKLGNTQFIGIGAGVGAMGAVGSLDDAVTFPVEAFGEFAIGGRLRVMARARAVWLTGAGVRDAGSPTLGFADELDGTLAVRLGHRYHEFHFHSGDGYFAGATYRELEGTKLVGIVLGYSIDIATPDRM